MSQLSLSDFLKDRCGFKENIFADVHFKLTEQGIDSVEMLSDLSIQDLQEINLSKIQSVVITNKVKLLLDQPQVLAEDPQNSNTPQDSHINPINHQNDVQNLDGPPKMQEVYVDMIDTSSNPTIKETKPNLTRPTAAKEQFRPSSGNKKIESMERMSTDNEQFVLFESFEDFGSEYKMSKIRLNEEQFRHLSLMIKENEIFPAAFYGDFDKCVSASYEYLGVVIPLKEHKIKEGILILKNGNKLALIYKTSSNEIFDYKNSAADQSHLASTYLRYLIDLCQTIVISPYDDFQMNPNLSNPFKASCNDRFVLKEEIIVPDEKVQIKEIPYAGDMQKKHDFKQMATSFDQSKYLPSIKVIKDQVQDLVKQYLLTSDIYGSYSHYTP